MSKSGQVIRSYREATGLSCAEFAQKLNIPEPTLRSLENGNRKITAERAVEIEEGTDGALTRFVLRPDLFVPPASGKSDQGGTATKSGEKVEAA